MIVNKCNLLCNKNNNNKNKNKLLSTHVFLLFSYYNGHSVKSLVKAMPKSFTLCMHFITLPSNLIFVMSFF